MTERKFTEERWGFAMFTAYIIVTLMTVAASTFVATANFMRLGFVLVTAARVSVPESWIMPLGVINAAGALGLLVGLSGVPLVGVAAAAGLVVYFVVAIVFHLRAHDYSIAPAAAFLLLTVAALVLGLIS